MCAVHIALAVPAVRKQSTFPRSRYHQRYYLTDFFCPVAALCCMLCCAVLPVLLCHPCMCLGMCLLLFLQG